jgi:hypothetical protein
MFKTTNQSRRERYWTALQAFARRKNLDRRPRDENQLYFVRIGSRAIIDRSRSRKETLTRTGTPRPARENNRRGRIPAQAPRVFRFYEVAVTRTPHANPPNFGRADKASVASGEIYEVASDERFANNTNMYVYILLQGFRCK